MAATKGLDPALVVFDSNGATVNVPMTGTSTAGSSAILKVTWTPLVSTPQTPVTVTSAGLTVEDDTTKEQGGDTYAVQAYIFRVHNVGAATNRNYVLNLPTTGGYGTAKITEWIGLENAGPQNTNSGGAANGTNPSIATGSASTTTAAGLAVACGGIDSGANPSIGGHPPTGWTDDGFEADQTAHMSGAHAYKITSSAAAQSATWTSSAGGGAGGAGTWAAVIAVYGATGGDPQEVSGTADFAVEIDVASDGDGEVTEAQVVTGSGAFAAEIDVASDGDGFLPQIVRNLGSEVEWGESLSAAMDGDGEALDVQFVSGDGAHAVAISVAQSGSGTLSAPAPVVAESGGGGFYFAFDRHLYERRKREREEEEEREAEQALQDEVDRNIAILLHEQERKDADRKALERLKGLVRQYADHTVDVERVDRALKLAAQKQTLASYEALEREFKRMQAEDEEFIFILSMISDLEQ